MTDARPRDNLDEWLKAMPDAEAFPFDIDPQGLYTVPALYRGYDPAHPQSWKKSKDNRIFEWFRGPALEEPKRLKHLKRSAAIAARLHDTAIERGITGFLRNKRTVGFMGGHDISRTDSSFRNVALMARTLRRLDFTIISGGGPGLMEAANFGAFLAPFDDRQFNASLKILSEAPIFTKHVGTWIETAARVRTHLLGCWDGTEKEESWSLGVPTWVYGHEPPNLFSSHIAKYFYNSLREDGLVTISNAGLIFGKGNAGTVQEIFQDATLVYYREDKMAATPMVLYGADFWNPQDLPNHAVMDKNRKPVLPLLLKLAREASQPFESALLLSDSSDEIVKFISLANPGEGHSPLRIADLNLSVSDS
jgi:predicted Rossmann-fold nucleotide-binding protein